MTETEFYNYLAIVWFSMAGIAFVTLFFVPAPYGRFTRAGWGPRMSNRLGWVVMELPACLVFFALWLLGDRHVETVPLIFLIVWQIHYIHRSLIFPFTLRIKHGQISIVTAVAAVLFNSGNGYLNARWLYTLGPGYADSWLVDPRFIGGMVLFWVGFAVNKYSDWVLLNLRKPGETGYKIPRGWLYRYISSPNYLGEIVQWGGWALMCFNIGSLSFFVWTVVNLVPRAFANHKWYREKFADYPPERKALIPFVL